MSDWIKSLNLDKGVYTQAAMEGYPLRVWLENQREKAIGPSLYSQKSNFEIYQLKHQLRKSNQPVPDTAIEEIIKYYGVNAFGNYADPVEKFFSTSATTTLFAEYVSLQVYAGAMKMGLTQVFIKNYTVIKGMSYKKVYLDDTEAQRTFAVVGAGGEFPSVTMAVSEQTVNLQKYGKQFLFNYEEIKDVPLPLVATVLQRVGQQIAITETDNMVYMIINGDNTANSNGLPAGNTATVATNDIIVEGDIVEFATKPPKPYIVSNCLGVKAMGVLWWTAFVKMNNPPVQWGFTSIQLPTFYEWDTSTVTSDRIFGTDDEALGYVTNDNMLLTETDRIIEKQKERYVISKRVAMHVIDKNGLSCLDTHS
jgi:hypothetical protein